MIYLTYNDQPSGIYNSQVIDVVKYLNSIQNKDKVYLVALISVRSFSKNRRLIKERLPESTVLPMIPKPALWKMNYWPLLILFSFLSHKKIMARGPFAAALALRLKRVGAIKKVIFDARGAYKAELNEYDVIKNENIKKQIGDIERYAVLNSDHRLAVSDALVNYWKKEFSYSSDKHSIIPCTLSEDFVRDFPGEEKIKQIKKDRGFNENDVVIVYSGSSAGWQSFELAEKLLVRIMEQNASVKLLWLTDQVNRDSDLMKKFGERIRTAWVKPNEVQNYLLAADHGLLYRENSVTNSVASPVKFAEYLISGLNIIISEDLGDYSEFVKKHNCGSIREPGNLQAVNYSTRKNNHNLAIQYLTKEAFKNNYLKLAEL